MDSNDTVTVVGTMAATVTVAAAREEVAAAASSSTRLLTMLETVTTVVVVTVDLIERVVVVVYVPEVMMAGCRVRKENKIDEGVLVEVVVTYPLKRSHRCARRGRRGGGDTPRFGRRLTSCPTILDLDQIGDDILK